MKNTLFAFLLVCSTLLAREPTICLNMIVKDESAVIKRSLASARPMIDYWVIVDTGSTDGTQEIIKEFMKGIPGELHERPWVNFEHNRNEALQLAKGKGDYLLFIDADEEFQYAAGFKRPKLDQDYYFITSNYGGSNYERNQLIKSQLDWKWVGVVHEVLVCPEALHFEVMQGVVNFVRNEGCRSRDSEKFLKDAMLLEAALEKEPLNARNVFYLAQSYRDAGSTEKAIAAYQKRVLLGGWLEEIFWSVYQIALLKEQQGATDWMENYTLAYQFRPNRGEPLYHLAKKFRLEGNYLMGYLVASYGSQISYPKDILFIEKWIYDYGLLLEKSISGYWLGKYEESLQISQKILKQQNLPTNVEECIEKNIEWALSKTLPNTPVSKKKVE